MLKIIKKYWEYRFRRWCVKQAIKLGKQVEDANWIRVFILKKGDFSDHFY
jgi:hypothetical protein